MRFWRSIRFRLALGSAAAVLLAGSVLGLLSWLELERTIEAALRELAHHEAREVAAALATLEDDAELVARAAELEAAFPRDGVLGIGIWTLDGRLLLQAPPGPPSPWIQPWPAGLRAALEGELPYDEVVAPGAAPALRTAVVARQQQRPRWLVTTVVSRADARAELAAFRRALVSRLAEVTALVFLGSLALMALALRPMLRLVEDARTIAAEGPGRRLAEPAAGSELGELARLLNRMLASTEATLARQQRFTAHAGHELRTPLMRIRAEAERALSREDDDGPAAREALSSVLEEVDELTRLVDALLELARGEARGAAPLEPLRLDALVGDLVGEAQVLGEARGLRLEAALPERPIAVRGNRALLGRAVWNLLDNALKFSPAGGRIAVRLEASGPRVELSVADEGPGLPPGDPLAAFEPFFRARPEVPGHGLGLSLSRTILRRHGGDLVAVLPPPAGRGACFRVSLPVDPASALADGTGSP